MTYGEDIAQYRLWESNINNSLKKLWLKSKTNKTMSFKGITEEKIYSNIVHIIDKYSKLNTVKNPEQLKESIEKKLDNIELIKEIEKFQTNKNNGLSLFATYAFCMDENMEELNLLHKDDSYSIELQEVAARIFESYVNIKLKEIYIKNLNILLKI